MIKLISLDVDGTLLDKQGNLSEANLNAIRAAKKSGVHVIINSGRPLIAMFNLLETLKIDEPVITLTGGLIWQKDSLGNWRILSGHPIPSSAFNPIYRAIKHSQVTIFLFSRNYGYVHHKKTDPYYLNLFEEFMAKNSFLNYTPIAKPPFLAYKNLELPAYKIMFYSNQTDEIQDVYRVLEPIKFLDLEVEGSSPDTVDIHHAKSGKKQAVEFICQRLGIQQHEVLALGDHESDLDLIEWAGVGAIMANARIYLKSIAPLIAPSNESNGVAEMIHAYAI